MEEIRQFGDDTKERDKEASTSVAANFAKNIDSHIDNQSLTASVFNKRQCRQTDVVTSESAVVDNNSVVAERASTSRRFDRFTMLLQYSKEFFGFLALILTTYATLLNKEPIIGGPLTPKPIFAKDSIVQEWPFGHLGDVQSRVAVSELSLIFFYAPWCAESLFAQKIYNAAANVYSKEVYFAAINCWQPNMSCRTNYSNVYKWPVLMAYFPKSVSVLYNGPWTYSSLTRFIERLITPIERVNSIEKLLQLRIANDAVVLGVFKSVDCKEYQAFFLSAIKWLQNISFQNVKFAVYVGVDTPKFVHDDNVKAPVIKLFTTNDSMVYDNPSWDSKHITNFIRKNSAKSQIWINLSVSKSTAMQNYLQAGPILLMFAPRVPQSDYYFIMKQLIYSYKSHQDNLNTTVLNNYISYTENEYPKEMDKLNKFCKLTKITKNLNYDYDMGTWNKKLYSLGIQTVNTSKHMSNDPHLRNGGSTCSNKYCEEEIFRLKMYYKPKQNLEVFDHRSPAEIVKEHMLKQCVHLEKLSKTFLRKAVVEPIIPSNKTMEHKLIQNRTLTFLMFDSIVYNDYLRNFIGSYGVQQYPGSSPAMLIVDTNNESLYLSKGPISTSSAMKFVEDFYSGKLRRHLRSSTIKNSDLEEASSSSSHIEIKEINSRQFSKIIKWTNVTSVVLFYSPQCSLCYIMSQTLLHVSHIIDLRNVQFYRIDATSNDFSWEYVMEKFPTLIVFPQNRSIETNVFPHTLKVTVQNVFGFILSNLKPEQQLKSLVNACLHTKWTVAFQNCVQLVRNMIGKEINSNLQEWRRYPSLRKDILKRLSLFNEIYMELQRAKKGSHLKDILKDTIIYENGDYAYIF